MAGELQGLVVMAVGVGGHRLGAQGPADELPVASRGAEPCRGGEVDERRGVVGQHECQVPDQRRQPASQPAQLSTGGFRLGLAQHGASQSAGAVNFDSEQPRSELGEVQVVVADGGLQVLARQRTTRRSFDLQRQMDRFAQCRQRGGVLFGRHPVPVRRCHRFLHRTVPPATSGHIPQHGDGAQPELSGSMYSGSDRTPKSRDSGHSSHGFASGPNGGLGRPVFPDGSGARCRPLTSAPARSSRTDRSRVALRRTRSGLTRSVGTGCRTSVGVCQRLQRQ